MEAHKRKHNANGGCERERWERESVCEERSERQRVRRERHREREGERERERERKNKRKTNPLALLH